MQPATTPPPSKPSASTPTTKPARGRLSFRTLLWIALLILFAFGLGYAPKELERRKLVKTLHATELDLRLANLHRQLGVASHEAQRNNFASAAAAARVFFDGCRAIINNEFDLADRPRTKLALQVYASTSDTVLGQLANADPAVKEQLASLYLTMNGLLERRQ
jgi:hypothetical protein